MAYKDGYVGGYYSGAVTPVPTSPVGTPSPLSTIWTFAAGPWTGLPTTELSDATSRSVTWRLVGSHEASLTIAGTSPQSNAVDELITDLWVLRNGQALFRGRFGASSDTGDEEGSLSTQFGAADYRELLARRFLYEGDILTYSAVEQSDIAWSLLSQTTGKNGGGLNVTRGIGRVSGTKRDRTYEAGASVGAMIDQLSQVSLGFDWDIRPSVTTTAQTFDVWFPGRGVDRRVVLDYGGRVRSFTRAVDPSTFGNAVRATGADGLAPARMESPSITTDPAGRWDIQYADDSVVTVGTLFDKAQKTLADSQYVQPSWTATLAPGTWQGPDDFWLGDTVTFVVKAGRLNVVETLRVVEIGLALDENNVDTITVTLGAPNPALKRSVRTVNKRLAALERR